MFLLLYPILYLFFLAEAHHAFLNKVLTTGRTSFWLCDLQKVIEKKQVPVCFVVLSVKSCGKYFTNISVIKAPVFELNEHEKLESCFSNESSFGGNFHT